jgi:hypothetical protein
VSLFTPLSVARDTFQQQGSPYGDRGTGGICTAVVEPWVPTIHYRQGNGGASGAVAGADKGGDIQVMEPVQHVLEQSAVQINADGTVVAQIALNFLTARGPKS